MIIYNKLRKDIIEILKTLVSRKPGLEIHEGEACPDHIHILLEIPPKYSVAEIMEYLKSKSILMIYDRHANLKYKYGNRHFWAKGYFNALEKYIENEVDAFNTKKILYKKYDAIYYDILGYDKKAVEKFDNNLFNTTIDDVRHFGEILDKEINKAVIVSYVNVNELNIDISQVDKVINI